MRPEDPSLLAEPDVAPTLQAPTGAAGTSRCERRIALGFLSGDGLRAQFLRAGVTGLLAGGIAVVFNLLVRLGESWRQLLLSNAHQLPIWGVLIWPLCAAILAGISVWLAYRFAPETSGSGIPHVKGVLMHIQQLRWRTVLPVKLLGGVAALSSGLSLGREGPTGNKLAEAKALSK